MRVHIDLQSINIMTEFFERGDERKHLEFSSVPLAFIFGRRAAEVRDHSFFSIDFLKDVATDTPLRTISADKQGPLEVCCRERRVGAWREP